MRRKSALVAMLALACPAVISGCQDYNFEEVLSLVIKGKRWSQTVSVSSKADILFVVDNSGSMAGEQKQLGESFKEFVAVLNEKFGDTYHIAVVTTGMESENCPLCSTLPAPGSCINETGEGGRFQDRLGFITDNSKDPPVFGFETDSSCRMVTNANTSCFYDEAQEKGTALVGVTGCGFERGLAPLRPALKTLKESYNAGFLRDDAVLAVVIISDEEDCGEVGDVYEQTTDGGNICYFAAKGEGPKPGVSTYTPMTYHDNDPQKRPYRLTPVEDYYNFLVNDVKGGRRGMVKFAAIVGVKDVKDLSTTTIDYGWDTTRSRWMPVHACTTAGCTGNYCYAEPGTRYIKLAQLFGIGQNGFVDTICQNDFSQTMKDLGDFVACPREFRLSEEPLDPALASILINDQQIPLYTCSIENRLEKCEGLDDRSCSQGNCVRTWMYCPAGDPSPQCRDRIYDNAAGGIIYFADHYDPCKLITQAQVTIEFVYVPRG